jgi:hypothetical protein
MAEGKLNVKRTQKDTPDGVSWKVERKRPIMPLPQAGAQVPVAEGVKP